MSPFHFCLSAAKNLSSFQLLPASLITDLLQLFLGLPLFLLSWGFQSRAAFDISPSSFLNVWPIHLNFLFPISKFISSCPVTFHRSLLEIIFGQQTIHRTTQIRTEQHKYKLMWKSAGRAPSLRALPWDLPYYWGKSTEKPKSGWEKPQSSIV